MPFPFLIPFAQQQILKRLFPNPKMNSPAMTGYSQVKEKLGQATTSLYNSLPDDSFGKQITEGVVSKVGEVYAEADEAFERGEISPAGITGGAINLLETVEKGARWGAENVTAPLLNIDPEFAADVSSLGVGLLLDKGLGKLKLGQQLNKAGVLDDAYKLNVPLKTNWKDTPLPPTTPTGLTPAYAGSIPDPKLHSTTPDLSTKGGNVSQITIKHADNLVPGAKEGFSNNPEFASWKDWYVKRKEHLLTELQKRKQAAGGVASSQPGPGKKYKDYRDVVRNDLSTGPTRLEDNPNAYGKKRMKDEKETVQQDTGQTKLQEHHLFSKGESNEFVRRMEEVGDMDDLVNMFLFAEQMDAVMGGRFMNMFITDKTPHLKGHSRRIKSKKGALGLPNEPGPPALRQALLTANNADDLMGYLREYIEDNVQLSKKDFQKMQDIWTAMLKANDMDYSKTKPLFNELVDEGKYFNTSQ